MVDLRWRYWQLLDPADESLRWLAITRPKAHARIDRTKMWTLLADKAVLVANWFVAEDHQRPEAQRQWIHDSITGWDFCERPSRWASRRPTSWRGSLGRRRC
ncbi:hypothetical protein [Gordonia polyisoprenivorans]|uniref:hypothetical protein n=1 Tax=Gordonia polyisoprenivorans TaxID=84595 RepID=UPI001FCA51A3|nr:hypothetical protein [Gordonia polyisoprenivorans]